MSWCMQLVNVDQTAITEYSLLFEPVINIRKFCFYNTLLTQTSSPNFYPVRHLNLWNNNLDSPPGFYHEQARIDRDDFVEINWDNIASRKCVLNSYSASLLFYPRHKSKETWEQFHGLFVKKANSPFIKRLALHSSDICLSISSGNLRNPCLWRGQRPKTPTILIPCSHRKSIYGILPM